MSTLHLRPPQEGGVATFAALLGQALGYPAIPAASAALDMKELIAGRSSVLFQYVGYGYARRGAPVGLVREVTSWRRREPTRRLVTVFHEVCAFGPPWRSSFWLSPVQRYLAQQLARASEACVTSTEAFAEILRRWVPEEKVNVLPVFSTIGEPEELTPWEERAPRMVIFGSPGVRERALHRTLEQLSRVVQALAVEELLDIGAPAAVPDEVAGVPVRSLGHLPPAEVGRLLASSRFGFVAYPPHLLGKSSVFAAYEANGLCPIVGWPKRAHETVEGQDERSLAAWSGAESAARPEAIAERAVAHYATHSLSSHVALHRALLDSCAS